jgi:hypothetical protein
MERRLWNDARGGKSNAEILSELRPIQNADLSVAPFYLEEAAGAPWQWGMTIDDQWIAGMAVIPGDRRGLRLVLGLHRNGPPIVLANAPHVSAFPRSHCGLDPTRSCAHGCTGRIPLTNHLREPSVSD